jgi:predicted transcriptional regulator
VRGADFKKWWTENARGARLFCEQDYAQKLTELNNYEDVPTQWDTTKLMVVAVPLTSDKEYLRKRFNTLLRLRHQKRRGRTVNKFAQSSAKYTLHQNYTIDNLDKCLSVYLRHKTAKERGERITLWRIGAELRLMPSSIPKPSDPPDEAFLKRQALAAAVSRYLKQANQRISNVVKGVFP